MPRRIACQRRDLIIVQTAVAADHRVLAEFVHRARVPTHAKNHDLALARRQQSAIQEKSAEGEKTLQHLRVVRHGSEQMKVLAVHRLDAAREDFLDFGGHGGDRLQTR